MIAEWLGAGALAGIVYNIRALAQLQVGQENVEKRLDNHERKIDELTATVLTEFGGEHGNGQDLRGASPSEGED